MILNFLNQYIYMITFFVVIAFFGVILVTKSRQWIIINKKNIAFVLGAGQFIAFWAFMLNNFLTLRWASSMLQDLCPLGQFVSIIAFVWQKEKFYKGIMPWLIIGASVTMLGASVDIFTSPWRLITYSQHTLMLIQGLFLLLIVSPYQKKEWFELLIFPSCLIIWNFIVGFIPWQVTGDNNWVTSSTALFPPALAEGSVYFILTQILPIPYPLPTILFYILALFLAYTLALSIRYGPIGWQKTTRFFKNKFHKTKNINNSTINKSHSF